MDLSQAGSPWLILASGVSILCALLVLSFAKKLKGRGDWLTLGALAIHFALCVWLWVFRGTLIFEPKSFAVGWIWPREETSAIGAGFFEDSVGAAISLLTILVSIIIAFNRSRFTPEQKPEKIYGALLFSTSGVIVAWNALTPWVSLLGLALTILGGVISFGGQWQELNHAKAATRFARDKSWGLLFCLFGCYILASQGSRLNWSMAEAWSEGLTTKLGAFLLLSGLLIQVQPFPLLSSLVVSSEQTASDRLLFSQVFPVLAGMSVLIREESQLRGLGILPAFGWIPLVSALLASATGIVQSDWKKSLSLWVSAGFSIAVASLCFSGTWTAMAWVLGVSLGSLAIAQLGSALEKGGNSNQSTQARGTWTKVGIFFGAACASGMFGFISAGGGAHWLGEVSTAPARPVICAFVLLCSVTLVWKAAWSASKQRKHTEASWYYVVSGFLLMALGLGVWWTGTASGGVLPGDVDKLMSSWLSGNFSKTSESEVPWLHWVILALAVFVAYWTEGRDRDLWEDFSKRFQRLGRFLASGYRVEDGATRALEGFIELIRRGEKILTQRRIGEWPYLALNWVTQNTAWVISRVDTQVSKSISGSLSRGVEVPGKLLQLVQSGDVQWYLFFAVGSGVAILVHFLR